MKQNPSRTARLQELRAAFGRLTGRPFPDDSADESTGLLHAELADLMAQVPAVRYTPFLDLRQSIFMRK